MSIHLSNETNELQLKSKDTGRPSETIFHLVHESSYERHVETWKTNI